ncbi:alpha/beta hydrolase [Diaminobutyricimonas sp. TR449]|uniref:alpha/beta fold hydrolase n=1 Tax=Diaminobutyricimonas sp. TR449 TaxID=2708076 RepID=UPI0014221234|nr:alpha/beta hydrolase [Diaminobutyricimonas sp. TR449]
MTNYRTTTVPVRGGDLTVGVWGPDGAPAVLAVHGVTATHRAWALVAEQAPELRIIAPDLRGRGRSNGLPGPWGMPNHADDMAAVLDAFGVDRTVVLGHSMGAFVSATLAMRHPSRVAELVLVDGGLPIPLPEGVTEADLPGALIGPAAARLAMRFESREAYREFWKAHPAFASDWSPMIEQYSDYDLDGAAPELTPSAVYEAVAADSLQLSGDADYSDGLANLGVPVQFVRAARGLLDQEIALYAPELVAQWVERMPQLTTHEAENVNHYTVVMAERGAARVLGIVRDALGRIGAASHTTEVSA